MFDPQFPAACSSPMGFVIHLADNIIYKCIYFMKSNFKIYLRKYRLCDTYDLLAVKIFLHLALMVRDTFQFTPYPMFRNDCEFLS